MGCLSESCQMPWCKLSGSEICEGKIATEGATNCRWDRCCNAWIFTKTTCTGRQEKCWMLLEDLERTSVTLRRVLQSLWEHFWASLDKNTNNNLKILDNLSLHINLVRSRSLLWSTLYCWRNTLTFHPHRFHWRCHRKVPSLQSLISAILVVHLLPMSPKNEVLVYPTIENPYYNTTYIMAIAPVFFHHRPLSWKASTSNGLKSKQFWDSISMHCWDPCHPCALPTRTLLVKQGMKEQEGWDC